MARRVEMGRNRELALLIGLGSRAGEESWRQEVLIPI